MSANGSRDGWITGLLDEHEVALLRYAQRITGDAERARDVVQDTFLKLTGQSVEELDGHAVEWLFTVCRNRALDVRRRERRRRSVNGDQVPERSMAEPGPAESVEVRESAERVVGWLDDLPENQQEVLRLKFQGGLSYRQIAGVTGHSLSNVGFLIHQGMKTLRVRMRRAESRIPGLPGEPRTSEGQR